MATGDLGAKRYAQAAFELASDGGSLNDWSVALSEIGEFMGNPEVERVLENTRVPLDAKLKVIDQALTTLPPLALNMARLLVQKGRTRLAPGIAIEFRRLADESQGIVHASAVTAVPLTEAEREALITRLQAETGKRIVLETSVDPALIGGLVIQIGDRMVDSSTRAKLHALHENLVGAI